jgi:hypothetical protein
MEVKKGGFVADYPISITISEKIRLNLRIQERKKCEVLHEPVNSARIPPLMAAHFSSDRKKICQPLHS